MSEESPRILVLDDEAIVCDRLGSALEKKGYRVETFTDSQKAIDQLAKNDYDLLITDLKMAGPSGLDVLRFVEEQTPGTRTIVITGYATVEQAKESMKRGAIDFIAKPFRISHLLELVAQTLEKKKE